MRARRLIGAASLAVVVACSDLRLNPAASFIQVAIPDPSFRFHIMPVLSQTCASSSACHLGPNPTTGLNLDGDSTAYANLYNVPAFSRSSYMRVKPGFADSSFFYLVLHDTASIRLGYPFRMPLTRYALPTPTTETIKNWINRGAKNN